jgi:hypothetical protein
VRQYGAIKGGMTRALRAIQREQDFVELCREGLRQRWKAVAAQTHGSDIPALAVRFLRDFGKLDREWRRNEKARQRLFPHLYRRGSPQPAWVTREDFDTEVKFRKRFEKVVFRTARRLSRVEGKLAKTKR